MTQAAHTLAHTKVTREDWLQAARDILVQDGVGEVKILTMGDQLGVSRSSFYWYFKNRDDLLNALLQEWESRNTTLLVAHCQMAATNITEAVCNFFRCFISKHGFDQRLDFAVREWSRRDGSVRSRIDIADGERITAVAEMFSRYGYGDVEADARARILYFMQLGYHALEVREGMDVRMARLEPYVEGFTGRVPDPVAIKVFKKFAFRENQS